MDFDSITRYEIKLIIEKYQFNFTLKGIVYLKNYYLI